MQRVLRVFNWKEPTGINRLNHSSLSKDGAVRIQVANVLVRNRRTAGVQASPKLSITIDYVERGSPGPLLSEQANREASCWRSGMRCLQ